MPAGMTPALGRRGVQQSVAGVAAGAIALTGILLAPGIDRANQTYPMAVGPVAVSAGAARPAMPPRGGRYLTRRTIEKIARQGVGKLHGLRIGPFAPLVLSKAMPLGEAEQLLARSVPRTADAATPTWLVTVDAPPQVDPSADPTSATVYSEIIDALSGAVIETCPGCATLDTTSC
jgi:hypothetical protein